MIYLRKDACVLEQIFREVKNENNQHMVYAGILKNLINEYDRFIITRNDFIYIICYILKLKY